MSDISVGLIGIATMFILMVLRTPVGMSMLVVGFFGTWFLNGFRSASAIVVTETFSSTSNYALTVVPLFILMGNIAAVTGFSKNLYDAAFAFIGHLRGGLASASIVGCAAFSAVSGSSVATAVTIGRVALPEMKRFKYGDALSTGSIAAGGTLGFLIPPSTGFVIYAILTEESIGRLFMAGILPGLLLTGLFIGAILVMTLINPDSGPRGNRVPVPERLSALYKALPLLMVIFISIGGIYLGVFTPVEAAGIGAVLIIGIACLGRRLKFVQFRDSLHQTVRTTAMLYLIVIGANVLNPFLALTDMPHHFAEQLALTGGGPYVTLLLILMAYIVLGMFMDGLSMLVITIPIVYPIIVGLGFDPIWFGVIAVLVIEMGMVTPPVGLNVFVVKSVAVDVPLTTIFKGVFPFWIAMLLCIALIIVFPGIALFIPNSMFG